MGTNKRAEGREKEKSWRSSSKASLSGPNERADLDFGAHSSREGCARESLAQSSELSERVCVCVRACKLGVQAGAPSSKFKAVARVALLARR